MRILVTDGENRAALAITRSLGRLGHEVIVGERKVPALAQTSRYCARRFAYADPVTASDAFVDDLVKVVQNHNVDVVIPVADITTFLVTRSRDRFTPCAIPFASAETIERAANKVEITQLALRLGVPVPATQFLCAGESIPGTLLYPVVIKPHRSRVFSDGRWTSSNVSYASDRDVLERDLAARPADHFPVMLQERIVGPGIGVFACYDRGQPVAWFGHRRLRERPPWGGVSVLSESVALSPRAREYAAALLGELGWHGVAMVEFKLDERDNKPKLMEINGRFWGSLHLAVAAGVDFPALLLRTLQPGPFPEQQPYRIGVRSRWLWGDFDSLLTSFGRNGPPGRIDPKPLKALRNFLHFWGPDLTYDDLTRDDPRPWLFESGERVRSAVRAVTSRRGRNGGPSDSRVAPAQTTLIGQARPSFENIGLLQSEWNSLAAASATSSIFQTYEWTRSWWESYGDLYDPCFVTISAGGRVCGLAPLAIRRPVGGSHLRVARFAGDGRADYLDILDSGDRRAIVREWLPVMKQDNRWDVVELRNIPAQSSTPDLLKALAPEFGLRLLVDDEYVCPTLWIDGQPHVAREVLEKASVRRRTNFLKRAGSLVCRDFSSAVDIEPYLDQFFEQHVQRWARHHRGHSLFLDERNRRFYRTLTRALSDTGWLLFSVVEFNGRPIAFHYGFDYNGALLWYKPTFDVAYERQSPGIVLVGHLIELALERNRRELDFTVGDEPFKRRFTNRTRKTVSIQLFRDSSRYYLERSKRSARKAARRLAS